MALLVWFPLNGNIENKGLSNVSSYSGSTPVYNVGKIGQCLEGSSGEIAFHFDDVDLIKNVCLNKKYTMMAWLKNNAASSGVSRWVFRIGNGAGTSRGLWENNGSATRHWAFNGSGVNCSTSIDCTQGWHHICFTVNETNVTLYVDGIKQGSATDSTTLPTENTVTFNSYRDSLNDFRLYDEVLSDKQVKEIAKGLCAHYKLEGVGANKNLLTNSHVENRNHSSTSYPCAAYPLESSVTANKKYTVSVNATFTDAYVIGLYFGGGSYGTQWVNCSQNGTYTLSWTFTANSNMAAQNFVNVFVRDADNTPKIGIAKCIVHWVKLEEGEIATSWIPNEADSLYTELGYNKVLTTDVSGFGYNGIITGDLIFDSDSPRYAGSTKFNGSSYITTTPGSLAWCNFDNLTISAWMKPTVKPGGWTGSIGIQQDGGTNGKVFSISNYAGNFSVHTDNGSGWVTTQSEALPLNQWSHCVATLTDGTNLKMYINGELVKTTTINYNTATVLSDTRIAIGVDLPGDDEKYTGYYSDARFYSTALSAEDILKLYEISGIIDNKGNTYSYEFIEED